MGYPFSGAVLCKESESKDMSDEAEVLLEMYKVQVQRSEHYEDQRAGVTNLVITLSAALVGLTTFDQTLSRADFWNGLLIVLIGIFGCIASKLHSSRSRRHGKRAAEYRNALNQLLPDAHINLIRDRIVEEKTYLYLVWGGLHLAVITIGIVISIFSITS
jgi:hypothetical protein